MSGAICIVRAVVCALTTVLMLLWANPVFAQETNASVTAGVGTAGLGLVDDYGRPHNSTGVIGWVDLTVAPRLAFEARVNWFPTKEIAGYDSQGGTTLMAMAGARGSLVRSQAMWVQGILQTGVIRFSRTLIESDNGAEQVRPTTHLAMDMGIGLEFLPRSRWAPRVDFLHTMYVVPGANSARSNSAADGPNLTLEIPGKIATTYQVNAGVSYRFGIRADTAVYHHPRRLTGGPQFTYSAAPTLGDASRLANAGVGGYLAYRLSDHVYADGVVNGFLRQAVVRTPWDGGYVLQGLAGVKVGIRREPVGLFVKVRSGINSHSGALRARDLRARTRELGRSNAAALDVGGIVEVSRGPRMVLRFEAGNVISFYRSRVIVLDGIPMPQGSARSRESIQMSVGIGWRLY